MDTSFLYLMALLETLLIFLIIDLSRREKRKTLAPAPRALPVVGHLHLLKEPLHRTLESLCHRLGPVFRLHLGRCRFLIVSSPLAVEQCLAQNDVVFSNRPPFLMGELLGYHNKALVWASYGDLWCNLRRAVVLAGRIKKSTSSIQCGRQRGGVLVRQERSDEDGGREKAAFLDVNKALVWASYGDLFLSTAFMTPSDFFPVLRWFTYGAVEKRIARLGLDRDHFLQALIDDKKAGCRTTSSCSVLDDLLTLQNQEPNYYTDDILKGIILTILTSGTTLARTMEWASSLLLNHPSAFEKARSEIDYHVGFDRLVDDSDLSGLNFLRCAVNETLRLYPVAPLLFPHYSSSDTTVAGYHVDKGTTLLVNVWALHRDPSLWEDPLTFKPERFEGKLASELRFKFIPFGSGRRACPASSLAICSIMTALATWIQCFDWAHPEGEVIDMKESGGNVTMPKSRLLQAICKPRSCMINALSRH